MVTSLEARIMATEEEIGIKLIKPDAHAIERIKKERKYSAEEAYDFFRDEYLKKRVGEELMFDNGGRVGIDCDHLEMRAPEGYISSRTATFTSPSSKR